MADKRLATIAITDIRENPVALRAVDRECEQFIGLRDSIATVGLLNPINVREKTETVDSEIITFYELCDGLHRYSACVDAGLEEIPVQVIDLNDAQVLEAQIMANIHTVDTKPVQYTKQMTRILIGNPTMTISDMATKLCKSPTWVSQRLGLLKLEPGVQDIVDDGKITVSNAVVMSKLPHEEQVKFVDQAMSLSSDEFVPAVRARAKELRDAARQGREPGEISFEPVARLQKLGDLKAELENCAVGPALCAANNAATADQGFALGVAWAIHMNPESIELQRAKAEEKARNLAEAKNKRAADRAEKKAKEAADAAAKAQEALGV